MGSSSALLAGTNTDLFPHGLDMCGGLISSERTLVPTAYWASSQPLRETAQLFYSEARYDLYASFAVFLCAQVLELLYGAGQMSRDFTRHWAELFEVLEEWYARRPAEMEPVLESNVVKGDAPRPFPIILFSNPPAISGNQIYHTAAILMLQKRPRSLYLNHKPRTVLWHARRVCSISISNSHHGCWTNSIQPLWIAGQVMSHPDEHRAILNIYEQIERETGWGAEWRARDLRDHWGDSDNEG